MIVRISVMAAIFGLSFVCAGQESSQLAEQPVLVARFNGWTHEGFAEYVRELNRDLQVGTRMLEAIATQKNEIVTTTIRTPASGFLVYMRRGLIPAAEQIQYSEVVSRDEFEKLVRRRRRKSAILQSLKALVTGLNSSTQRSHESKSRMNRWRSQNRTMTVESR